MNKEVWGVLGSKCSNKEYTTTSLDIIEEGVELLKNGTNGDLRIYACYLKLTTSEVLPKTISLSGLESPLMQKQLTSLLSRHYPLSSIKIIEEPHSSTTYENLHYSSEGKTSILVTDLVHIPRTRKLSTYAGRKIGEILSWEEVFNEKPDLHLFLKKRIKNDFSKWYDELGQLKHFSLPLSVHYFSIYKKFFEGNIQIQELIEAFRDQNLFNS